MDVLERHYKKLPDDVAKNIGVSGWALINPYLENLFYLNSPNLST
jgi:hypothetical protein